MWRDGPVSGSDRRQHLRGRNLEAPPGLSIDHAGYAREVGDKPFDLPHRVRHAGVCRAAHGDDPDLDRERHERLAPGRAAHPRYEVSWNGEGDIDGRTGICHRDRRNVAGASSESRSLGSCRLIRRRTGEARLPRGGSPTPPALRPRHSIEGRPQGRLLGLPPAGFPPVSEPPRQREGGHPECCGQDGDPPGQPQCQRSPAIIAVPAGISAGQPDDHRSPKHQHEGGDIQASVNSSHGTPVFARRLGRSDTYSLPEIMSYVGSSIKP